MSCLVLDPRVAAGSAAAESPPVAAPRTTAAAKKALPTLKIPGAQEALRNVDGGESLCTSMDATNPLPLPDFCPHLLHSGMSTLTRETAPAEGKRQIISVMTLALRDVPSARAAYRQMGDEPRSQFPTVSVPPALGDERVRFQGPDGDGMTRDALVIRTGTVVITLDASGVVEPATTARLPEYGATAVATAQRAQADVLAAKETATS
ncbi:hypothetical protein ACFVIM_02215 [Streptomyces sp. NPDC057638]|uniref:hypothetical protein n=1 Tax=Streptomyces sp. NPDC057638 TaxID=3346190 RepID=UPI0036760A0E